MAKSSFCQIANNFLHGFKNLVIFTFFIDFINMFFISCFSAVPSATLPLWERNNGSLARQK